MPNRSVLDGCSIAISGQMGQRLHKEIAQEITAAGGSFTPSVTRMTTHLITSRCDFERGTSKVRQAVQLKLPLVDIDWLDETLRAKKLVDVKKYEYSATGSNAFSPKPTPSFSSSDVGRKRSASPSTDAPKRKRTKADADADGDGDDEGEMCFEDEESTVDEQVAQSKDQIIPADDRCPLLGHVVYIGDDMTIYDVTLNLTRTDKNCNKFYRMQLLKNDGDHRVWCRWGRQGEPGQGQTVGNGSLADALSSFRSRFKSKTGLGWENRQGQPKPGKYVFSQASYFKQQKQTQKVPTPPTEEEQVLRSKIDHHTEVVLSLIFNPQSIADAAADLNYDAKALPLSNLSQTYLLRGYEALRSLHELITNRDDPEYAKKHHGTTWALAIQMLTDNYFTIIPHSFGRRMPPPINSIERLQVETRLMESLYDLSGTVAIMGRASESQEGLERLLHMYNDLNLDRMELVKPDQAIKSEYYMLQEYLNNTADAIHGAKFDIEGIFRIARAGEKERFDAYRKTISHSERRLLWHGSRTSNFGGILREGLRIAPPEAPVTGHMFGKGIYLADMSSKSGRYCFPQVAGDSMLLMLCEAELGQMNPLIQANYTADEDAKKLGCQSTWGQGKKGPEVWKDAGGLWDELHGVQYPDTATQMPKTISSKAHLLFNEYICYNVAQVQVRYLFHVKICQLYGY